MKKLYFKRILQNLRQEPVVTTVSILGTAFAIFMIMVVVVAEEVHFQPFAPESNRDRFLIVNGAMCIQPKTTDSFSYYLSEQTAKEVFLSLKTPEAVTLFDDGETALASAPGAIPVSTDLKQTDHRFWHVFDFDFINGKPYNEAAFKAAQRVAVITERVARELFNSTDVIGKEIDINHTVYRICGVVKTVSTLTSSAYSQIWIPYTTTDVTKEVNPTPDLPILGTLKTVILVKNKSDMPKVLAEVKAKTAILNKKLKPSGWKYADVGRPCSQLAAHCAPWSNEKPDIASYFRQLALFALILLLVPAINLSSMTQSRLRRYISEIGVRRAFGCRRSQILSDIIWENLVLSIIAGLVGLIFCVLFAYFGSNILFAQKWINNVGTPIVSLSVLLNPFVLVMAFIFCFILNLLSTIIPAWQASRTNIVNALNGKTH